MIKNKLKCIIVRFLLSLMLVQVSLSANDVDIDILIEEAKKTDKHLFILLSKTGCSWCAKMKKSIFDDEEIRSFLKKDFLFEFVDIKEDGTVTSKDFKGSKRKFSKHLGHNFYPTSVFINKDNEIVFSQPGIVNNAKFLLILDYIKSKSYVDFSFQAYVDEKEFD